MSPESDVVALQAESPIAVIGAQDVESGPTGVIPQRLSAATRALIADEQLKRVARMGAGVRLAFSTDSESIEIAASTSEVDDRHDSPHWDLVIDGTHVQSAAVGSAPAESEPLRFSALESGMKSVELWLPQYGVTSIREIRLASGAVLLPPPPDNRPVMITYGSSITQCRDAYSPKRTWPSLVADQLNATLINRGFAGECYLDPVVGEELAGIDAEYIHLCLGANVYSGGFNRRTLGPAVIGLIQRIRARQPDAVIGVMSPIPCPARENTVGGAGMSLRDMRAEIRNAVERVQSNGGARLHYLDGADIVREPILREDGLHPTAEGILQMSTQIAGAIRERGLVG